MALAAFFALTAQSEPILVPQVSQHEVRVRQGFTGTQMLLFGAVLDPSGGRMRERYDIVVVLKGPTQPILLREKAKRFGIWLNADSTAYRSVPSFFAVASSRPIGQIVDPRTAAIYELGLNFLQLSPTGAIEPKEQARFTSGLVDLMRRHDLDQENPRGVTVDNGVLYQARIDLPSNVVTGRYTAETFAIARGRVMASAITDVEVKKIGFEKLVADKAEDSAVLYGLFAVGLSVLMGWAAGRLFSLV